jgi:8-oxo-dGTP pyrophosphatase MutT (NUDIX family)
LIGGKYRETENSYDCLLRELREELGEKFHVLTINDIKPLFNGKFLERQSDSFS